MSTPSPARDPSRAPDLGELLARHLPQLQLYLASQASGMVMAKETPEDLAQSVCRELFERVQDGRFSFRDEPSFRKWLFRAALLKVLNRHRFWNVSGREDQGPFSESKCPGEGQVSPSVALENQEELLLLELSFSKLPERYREVITLHHVEGWSHREIATHLEISEGNSTVLLARAMAALARVACGSETGDN